MGVVHSRQSLTQCNTWACLVEHGANKLPGIEERHSRKSHSTALNVFFKKRKFTKLLLLLSEEHLFFFCLSLSQMTWFNCTRMWDIWIDQSYAYNLTKKWLCSVVKGRFKAFNLEYDMNQMIWIHLVLACADQPVHSSMHVSMTGSSNENEWIYFERGTESLTFISFPDVLDTCYTHIHRAC